ncbi:hypothetical protein BYT27DRAFT_7254824 [Phlegmacium glaucopus]|nr:hypothetical protein BYT27DRAFT_7254824 [Phlegmacium glaucopus]
MDEEWIESENNVHMQLAEQGSEDAINLDHDFNTKGIDANIRHEAIPVPSGPCPFGQEGLELFESGFKLLTESGELPSGYGVTLDELDEDIFDEQEEIIIGKKRNAFPIALPSQIWKP